jgi:hypothetical protein
LIPSLSRNYGKEVESISTNDQEFQWMNQVDGEQTIQSGNSWEQTGDSDAEIPLASAFALIDEGVNWANESPLVLQAAAAELNFKKPS